MQNPETCAWSALTLSWLMKIPATVVAQHSHCCVHLSSVWLHVLVSLKLVVTASWQLDSMLQKLQYHECVHRNSHAMLAIFSLTRTYGSHVNILIRCSANEWNGSSSATEYLLIVLQLWPNSATFVLLENFFTASACVRSDVPSSSMHTITWALPIATWYPLAWDSGAESQGWHMERVESSPKISINFTTQMKLQRNVKPWQWSRSAVMYCVYSCAWCVSDQLKCHHWWLISIV